MSKEQLPPTLSPFATNHPASAAYRITLSPHEWTWTQAEQEAMARALVERDAQLIKLRELISNWRKLADECPQLETEKVVMARCADQVERAMSSPSPTRAQVAATIGKCRQCGKPTFGGLCAKCKGEK